jgi:hypothetical protein
MGFHEVTEAAQYITDQAGDDSDVYWGAVVDPTISSTMRVTLIATGFERSPAIRMVERPAHEEATSDTTEPAVSATEEVVASQPAGGPQKPSLPPPRVVPLSPDEPIPVGRLGSPLDDDTVPRGQLHRRSADPMPPPLEETEKPAERWIEEQAEGVPEDRGADRGPALWRRRSTRQVRLPDRLDGLRSDGRNPLDIPTFLRKQMD